MSSRHVAAALAATLLLAACAGPAATPSAAPTEAVTTPAASASSSSVACDRPAATPPPGGWWRDRVFYEVFVRSFADSDGDGIGDLRGLTAHLDHLNDGDPATTDDLGVTGLWLMPIAESPSYHGYDVVDYRAVEADYGTADDFRALVDAAHERGIAVILDLVINHTSREHPWFQDARTPGSAHDEWYVWSDDHPGIARSDGSRVWHPDGDRFYYGYFWEGMPDLDLGNAAVTDELDTVADFWLADMGVDGFRLDAARHLFEDGRQLENVDATFDWLTGFRERIKARHPEALVLGEVWDASSMSARYVRDGALDLTFDFGLAGATITSLRSGERGALRAAWNEVGELYPDGGLATFLTNHDQDRIMTQLGGDGTAAKLAGALLLTGAGTPFVYYGEEIGLTGQKPDERIRTPMRWDASTPTAGFTRGTPWQPLGDDPPGTDVASEMGDPDSLLSGYRDLVALRTAHPALSHGDLTIVDADSPSVVAYLRHDPGASDTALVMANLSDEPVTSVTLGLDEGPLCRVTGVDLLYGSAAAGPPPLVTEAGGFDGYVPVERLGPRELVVLELAG
jgi:glycosidase